MDSDQEFCVGTESDGRIADDGGVMEEEVT